jgi:hypothetical protein
MMEMRGEGDNGGKESKIENSLHSTSPEKRRYSDRKKMGK